MNASVPCITFVSDDAERACDARQVDIWTRTSDAEEYDKLSMVIANGVTSAAASTRADNHDTGSSNKVKGGQRGGVPAAEAGGQAAVAQEDRTKGENDGANRSEDTTAADGDKAEAGQAKKLSTNGGHAGTRLDHTARLARSPRIVPISMSVSIVYFSGW